MSTNNCCHWLCKVAQSAINHPIWSHCVQSTFYYILPRSYYGTNSYFRIDQKFALSFTEEIHPILQQLVENNFFLLPLFRAQNFNFIEKRLATKMFFCTFSKFKKLSLINLLSSLHLYISTYKLQWFNFTETHVQHE